MSQTAFNIEIKFFGEKKWQYVNQQSSLKWAMIIANKPYYKVHRKRRIRKVIKTIVWKSND